MPAQTIVTKKKPAAAATPTDRKPKATAAKAATTPIIDIEDEDEPIPVRLVGVDYTAHRPKAMLAVRLGERIQQVDMEDMDQVVEQFGSFLRLTFGTEVAAAILARLEDEDDRLDVHHLLKFVERITEVVGGRPSTSPPASDN
ncbi:tail assembly chaperone [Microbacterium phage NoodlelyBoi]|uniref:Tail assembly chaperone n=1 Tax=Microbacterium phage NoodlelyBoi TaxID=2813165 RepID=A0A899IQS5_9CAUD|nr:tail assembly chaperone [Microbacterium phage NoodlelyBoi]QSM01229.1 tail assembly chaperone [Microbacterium phage NoodlelyBoi]